MTVPATTTPAINDVLHNEQHSHLSIQEIAKAVARHKREHPTKAAPTVAAKNRPVPQKTTPRG
ncbi:MAG TPA: hypothetical protein VHZ09_12340 [Acidobacteriaceae bacterium]|jgi:hypothetical protein|nr:hypothetical protein [Acidobacteriaceae bacterium]